MYFTSQKAIKVLTCAVILAGPAVSGVSEGSHGFTARALPEPVVKTRQSNKDLKAKVAIYIHDFRGHKKGVSEIAQAFENLGHHVVSIKDGDHDPRKMERQLNAWVDEGVNAIVCVGGTGIAPDDHTDEVMKRVVTGHLPGYGELFRYLTFEKWKKDQNQIGILAIDSRAAAGFKGKTLIFSVPSSADAVDIALNQLILPDLPFLMGQLNKQGS